MLRSNCSTDNLLYMLPFQWFAVSELKYLSESFHLMPVKIQDRVGSDPQQVKVEALS